MVTVAKSGTEELFDFAQAKCPDGYRVHAEPGVELGRPPRTTSELLIGAPSVPEIRPASLASGWVRPLLESEDLAAEFAEVGPTDADICAFANAFGLLYPLGSPGNSVERFRNAQKWVADLRAELDRLRGKWEGKASALQFRRARRKLGQWFNAEASDHFTYRLRLPAADNAKGGLTLAPGSLMDAIALRLAYEITGEIEWGRCAHCDRWFPKGAAGERVRGRNATTCSEACTRQLMDGRKSERVAAAKAAKAPPARKCVHCGESFKPKRAATIHCGKPACKTAVSRMRSQRAKS